MTNASIRASVRNITVNAPREQQYGYFSFDYTVWVNGKKTVGSYNSSFSGRKREAFRKLLKRGYAWRTAVQQVLE